MINILDVIILILIIYCGFLGFKNGAVQCGIKFIGLIICIILAYILKDTVANLMITHLPFFDFGGVFKGVSVLNILIYEAIAFLSLFSLLYVILRILINLSGILEKLLNATVILGIGSKILGLILGLLEGYIYAFALVFILSLCTFSIKYTQDSKLNNAILNNTPILASFATDSYAAVSEIYTLKDKYEEIDSTQEYNYEALEILLKHNVVTTSTIQTLLEQDKIQIDNIDELLLKYKED